MTHFSSVEPCGGHRCIRYSLRTVLGIVAVLCGVLAVGVNVGWGASLIVLTAIVIAASIWISRSVQLVRLLGAVAVAVAACWFVVRYDCFARARFGFDHPGERVTEMQITKLIGVHAAHAYAVPIVALTVGASILYLRPHSRVLIELLVTSLWVLAFAWVLNVILLWQVQNVPFFSGMRWHY